MDRVPFIGARSFFVWRHGPPAAPFLPVEKGGKETLGGGQGGNFVPAQPSPQTPGERPAAVRFKGVA